MLLFGEIKRIYLWGLEEKLNKVPCLWTSKLSAPLFPFVCEEEGNSLGGLTPKHGPIINPRGILANNSTLGHKDTPPCFRAIPATAFLVKAMEEIVLGSPSTIVVRHEAEVEAFPNSHCAQHLLVRHLTSYEILLLTAPHITPHSSSPFFH